MNIKSDNLQIGIDKRSLIVLNLYAGIGGNRKGFAIMAAILGIILKVIAVEHDRQIAAEYKRNFPDDTVITCDGKCDVDEIRGDCPGNAHEYLRKNYDQFMFIWTSTPCPTHSITNYIQHVRHGNKRYQDAKLYQEINYMKVWCNSLGIIWVAENVEQISEWTPRTATVNRHYYWSNRYIENIEDEKEYPNGKAFIELNIDELQQYHDIQLSDEFKKNTNAKKKRQVLRNCVYYKDAAHIFNWLFNNELTIKVSPSVEEWL